MIIELISKGRILKFIPAILKWVGSPQGQNPTRRGLVVGTVLIWAATYIMSIALSLACVWADNPSKYIESINILDSFGGDITLAMTVILSSYLVTPHTGDILNSLKKVFIKNN